MRGRAAENRMAGGGGRHWVSGALGGKSAISLTEWSILRGIPPRMAESGATRHGCRRFRPVQFSTTLPIPLVKSDLETALKPNAFLRPLPFCFPPPCPSSKSLLAPPPLHGSSPRCRPMIHIPFALACPG